MALDDYLTETVHILAFSASTLSAWGSSGSWAETASVKGQMRYTGGREIHVSDKDTVLTSHRLYVKQTTAITERNRLVIDGKVYDVKNVARPIRATFNQIDIDYLPEAST